MPKTVTSNRESRIDPYHASRPYWCWWEGCEPIACTAREAEAQLWCAFLCGSFAKYQDQRTSYTGANKVYKSDLLRRDGFEKLDKTVQEYVLLDLQDYRLEHLRSCIAEVLNEFPKITGEGKDKYLYLGSVECYAETFWALRRDCTKFTIGINTGDDFNDLLTTSAHLQAAVKFATLCFEEKAKATLEKLQ